MERKEISKSVLKSLNEGDTLIVCGDFGFIWDKSKAEQIAYIVEEWIWR